MQAYDDAQEAMERRGGPRPTRTNGSTFTRPSGARTRSAEYHDRMDRLNELYKGRDRESGTYQNTAARYGRDYLSKIGVTNPEREYAEQMARFLQARKDGAAIGIIHKAAASAADRLSAATDDAFMTSFERFDKHMKAIDRGEQEHWGNRELGYTSDEARRRRQAETEQELSHAGIRRPMDDFKKSYEELVKLRERGTINPDEFAKRERELRRQAISGQLEGLDEIQATAAVGAGSREAFNAQVSAQLNDPRTALMNQTNKTLDAIEKRLADAADKARPIVAEAAGPF